MDKQQQYDLALQKIQDLQTAINVYQQKTQNLFEITKSLETQIYRIIKNESGKYVYTFSEGKVAENFNIATDNIAGKELKDVLGKALFDQLKSYFDKAFKGEIASYRGFLFRNRFFSTTVSPFKRNSDEKVIEISGVTQDITELFETERKYKEKTEVLNNIIEYNPYSIQICDANGYQIKHNNAFLKIFKTSPAREWSLFTDPLIKQMGIMDEIKKVLLGEIVDIPEIWYNSHDIDPKYPDNLRCLRAIHFPIFNIKHVLENIIIMHEDITSKMDLKKRVKELEEFNELTVGRELIMKEMEHELEQLKLQIIIKSSKK